MNFFLLVVLIALFVALMFFALYALSQNVLVIGEETGELETMNERAYAIVGFAALFFALIIICAMLLDPDLRRDI
jgi:hypothetical protein